MEERDTSRSKPGRLRRLWPEVREIVSPRVGLLTAGLVLVGIRSGAGLVLPLSMRYLVDQVIGRQRGSLLVPLMAVVVAAVLVQAGSSLVLTQLMAKAAQRLTADLRRKVHEHLTQLPVSYFDAHKTGELVYRIMNDVEGVQNLIGNGLIEFIGGILTALFAIVALLRISVAPTLVALSVSAMFVLMLRSAFRRVRPLYRERSEISAAVTGRLNESLGGVRVVKGYNAQHREHALFSRGVDRLLGNALRLLTTTSVASACGIVLMGIVGAAVMFLGARAILAHTMTLGDFVTFGAVLAFLVAPMFQVVTVGTQITEALAGLERTRQVLSEVREDADPARTASLEGVHGAVEFRNVSFAYDRSEPVVHDLSFACLPGTATALVGSSGSGKSTIIGLIAGFYKPGSGKVLVDGTDLTTVRLPSYRSHLGLVLQETFLFDGTIRDNVMFSRPGATEEQFLDACRAAYVDEFAERLPNGYDTLVGERGVKLSGGQKQRISIARALLADPQILILDEATSSLDSGSEALIHRGMHRLMQGRTSFVIAHRLSTIRRCGQILVVENGHIVERGTHEKLCAAGGRYREMYDSQFDLETDLFVVPEDQDGRPAEPEPEPAMYAADARVDSLRLLRT